MIRNPGIAAIAKQAGLDFFMLDAEHGTFDMETIADIALAARAADVGCFIRVPELAKSYVSRVLDAGCTGVMVPMVSSVEEAERLAGLSKFDPPGKRGLGTIGNHTGYRPVSGGMAIEFTQEANQDVLCIAQIETVGGVENVEGIAAVQGVDALLIGPMDLSMSLGHTGDLKNPVVIEAIEKVAAAARANNKAFGIHGPDWLIEQFRPKGLNMIMSGLDMNMIHGAMKQITEKWQAER
jgi:2-keto-3-deoxy-L-rhamnonate aldolase RhmA